MATDDRPKVIRVEVDFDDGTTCLLTGEAADIVFRAYQVASPGILPLGPPLVVPGMRAIRWGNPTKIGEGGSGR